MINLEKIKEEMIEKNEFFKIKKGSEWMVVPELPDVDTLQIKPVMVNSKRDVLFHPNWLFSIYECEECSDKCSCNISYNFQHQSPDIRQFVVKENDVVKVSGSV